ncbi:Acetyl-coenzyme A carboxylase carboxyl transferase subunit alpha [Piscirickettsia salmonis]|uniref:acetyl-CoA carboxylase carboxyltransferase subunit alpha n=1 Tax=Piscirickettsia salmonis TaxID=1238 RepID=UPI0012BAED35|nr:acetyl-CoA carboxylase carboxyltransferase subunit alpha [Piscirickettsia salmonis]QGP53784.1 Acetyl-coenzyme A carboxylase carboxyl transferase subunit alpha [Piscirickettsia salmonis]QGP60306.1 Acetyl-coenzyme A carboxylase carboxyl transferase subunit alpha [Piscirickettsia salmonis]QGP63368.1 Acetyl-coenzyme A carboxylase carboxyl transferase subunit alpha [Piscirickettsia salmonis]
MNLNFLDFEQPIAELEAKIETLRSVSNSDINISNEIESLEEKSRKLTESIFSNLSAWQVIQLARHPQRPYTLDYIKHVFTEFDELHGDRAFADDKAVIGGVARLNDQPVMVIGQQKGRDAKERTYRNFGMPHPEGYRKALRLMKMAERFKLPVVTFIDTPGAYPGVGAEARGQAEAIARNLFEMSKLRVPVICCVIGEGCSGGALGIGVGDVTLMLQYSYYATISPEGCAAILWHTAEKASDAAEIMGITADRLLEHGIADEIIAEPLGGAHRDFLTMSQTIRDSLSSHVERLKALPIEEVLEGRYQRFMRYGTFETRS